MNEFDILTGLEQRRRAVEAIQKVLLRFGETSTPWHGIKEQHPGPQAAW